MLKKESKCSEVWWVSAVIVAFLVGGCVSSVSEDLRGVSAIDEAASVSTPASSISTPGSSVAGVGGEGLSDNSDSGSVPVVSPSTSAVLSDDFSVSVSGKDSLYVGGEGSSAGVMGEEEYDERVKRFFRFSRPDYSGYSDEYVTASAFRRRGLNSLLLNYVDLNDRSTPVGAFCWVAWSGFNALVLYDSLGEGNLGNLGVWYLEREAAERGIELFWETGRFDYDLSLRRLVLEATSPEVRDVVFDPGLPVALRPVAEGLYDVFEELSALPVRSVRPAVEELSDYPGLEEVTEEEVSRIWLEEFEVDLDEDDFDTLNRYVTPFRELFGEGVRYGEEVREIVNSECRTSPDEEWAEMVCPAWVAEVLSC